MNRGSCGKEKNRAVLSVLFFLFLSVPAALASEAEYIKPRLAVIPFETSNVDPATVQGVTELIQSRLENSGLYVMIERAQLTKVLNEQAVQHTGLMDENTAINIGRMIGATKLVLGSIYKIEDGYTISARIVDVETGMIEMSDTQSSRSAVELKDAVDLAAKNIVSKDRSKFQSFLSLAAPEKGLSCLYIGAYSPLLHFDSYSVGIDGNLAAHVEGTSMSLINPSVGFRYYVKDKVFVDFGYIPSSSKVVAFDLSDTGVVNHLRMDAANGPTYIGSINYTFHHTKAFRFSTGIGTAYSTLDMHYRGNGSGYCYYTSTYGFGFDQGTSKQFLLYFATVGGELLIQKKFGIGIFGSYFAGNVPETSLKFQCGYSDDRAAVNVFKPKVDHFNVRVLASFYF